MFEKKIRAWGGDLDLCFFFVEKNTVQVIGDF
jgi:hypothetical protein